jgi:hypothetical protein
MEQPSPDSVIHLTIQNHFGSVEHYYHFLLGFLVPLVNWYHTHDGAAYPAILVRSCAVLDPLIHELGLPNLVVLDKEVHRSLIDQPNWDGRPMQYLHLEGYDNELLFASEIFVNAAQYIKKRLGIPDSLTQTADGHDLPAIVVIGRKPPNPFYLTAKSEKHNAGSMRRSIPNLTEIAEALHPLGELHLIYLEDHTFKEQIQWFMRADVIVAQHGAALASLIFCRKGTAIVEILPPNRVDLLRLLKNIVRELLGINTHRGWKVYKTLFFSLSRTLHLRYYYILQKDDHSPVHAKKVLNVVSKAV